MNHHVSHRYLEGTVAKHESVKRNKEVGKFGQLNPDWVEFLMQWPIKWTSLKSMKKIIWLNWEIDPADFSKTGNFPTPRCFMACDARRKKESSFKNIEDVIYEIEEKKQSTGLIPRVSVGTKNRKERLKAIGNGQVPRCFAEAFKILSKGLI